MPGQDITCDACGLPPHAAESAPRQDDGLPATWVRRKIGRRTFTLCDVCGSIRHFKGGISAYLQDALGVGPNAECDFMHSTEPGSGLHKYRIRDPGSSGNGSEGET